MSNEHIAEMSQSDTARNCVMLLDKIAKRYDPKFTDHVKSKKGLTEAERIKLFDAGCMAPPDPTTTADYVNPRYLRYRYTARVRIPGKTRVRSVIERCKVAVEYAIAYMNKHGYKHGFLRRVASERKLPYSTFVSRYHATMKSRNLPRPKKPAHKETK